VRKINGATLGSPTVASGLLDLLRLAGFVEGYRGFTYRVA
jgi:hypothetical protein